MTQTAPVTPSSSQALDEIKIGGLGSSRLRVEDSRFIRGRGNYTDDVKLPGMLYMEILRSPLAHARIVSIDTSRAWQIPGVHLVLTGEMMATRNLAWMPTLSYDTQAVLATDKVRFQGQEVAFVIATDEYIARDALQLIDDTNNRGVDGRQFFAERLAGGASFQHHDDPLAHAGADRVDGQQRHPARLALRGLGLHQQQLRALELRALLSCHDLSNHPRQDHLSGNDQ